jgi:general secretion pathway protein D
MFEPLPGNRGTGVTQSSYKFEEAPIADVVHILLRDVAKVDYMVYPPLGGSVTLATRGDVSADQAIYLLESALQANGLAMVQDTRGVYHVGRPESLRGIGSALRQTGMGVLPAGQGPILLPLKFIGANEMATILRPMVPAESFLRVDTVRNLLVLSGTRSQAEGWLNVVTTFDIDILRGMSVGVFALKHATVAEVEAAIRLMSSSGPAAAAAGAAAQRAGAGSSQAAGQSGSDSHAIFGAVRIMPIERLNSLLVVTPRAAYLDQAREWIERLDKPGDSMSEPQLFVYPVQNGSARHLASLLSGLFGTEGKSGPTSSSVAPTLAATTAGTTGAASVAAVGSGGSPAQAVNQSGTRSAAAGSQTSVSQVSVGTGVRAIADEVNNALLIYGSRADYNRIEAALKRLDLSPTQVLIEASIIEVSLNDELQYGLQWLFTDPRANGNVGTGVLSTIAGGAISGAAAGFSYTLRNSLGSVRAVLNALADKSLVRVISSPSLMVLDNHMASIVVGNQQPIRTGEITNTAGVNPTTSVSYQYKDTGVALSVTPSVNAGNIVTMQINQAVTDVGAIDGATGQRTFLQRQIGSKVAVRSGETLVLGGLIRDNSTTGRSGIPGLQDIPLVGNFFGSKTNNSDRTELLVVITPRVIRSDQQARDAGAEMRERMKVLFPAGKVSGGDGVTR